MDLSATVLGIDIAKLKFDGCLIRENGKAKHKVFQNTRHGFEQLVCWLDSHKVAASRACLEATGTYGEALSSRRAASRSEQSSYFETKSMTLPPCLHPKQ